jgi:hypothetical protein
MNNMTDIKEIKETKETKETKKCKKKLRCGIKGCQYKINKLFVQKCKCGNIYCSNHIFFDNHDCTFDYQKQQQNYLKKTMEKIIPDKLEKITDEDNEDNEYEKRKQLLRKVNPIDFLNDFTF